jgi:DMSO reductase anchor subunit
MNPAPSVLLFTVLSGLGFGFLAALGVGLVQPAGWTAFALWGLGYGLTVGGLLASTTHLGRPDRAWRAFSQWRSSWLSREGIAAVATLLILAPVALSDWLGLGLSRLPGMVGAVLALATIATTSMIYAQLKTVPRWNHWTTPAQFFAFALAGGAMLAGQGGVAIALLALLAAALAAHWHFGDRRFGEVGATMGSATGLGDLGAVSVFDPAHTAGNYLMREMGFHVAGRHAVKLRRIVQIAAFAIPLALLILASLTPPIPAAFAAVIAAVSGLAGTLVERWLFFAEAKHSVTLYYGADAA